MIQCIINFLDNAIKYTPKGSHILIHVFKQKQEVCIAVQDDGSGITEEKKQNIFDMFYTGNMKAADSRRSLGLGLALCKSIVNAVMPHEQLLQLIQLSYLIASFHLRYVLLIRDSQQD